jgi:1-deoxy-D-xylulose-5-phosphate reductoisomerase
MPIQYALSYPERMDAPVPRYDWSRPHAWEFEPPDLERFPLLRLAYEAQRAGGSATCSLNAADEVAVEAFLERRLPFSGIAGVVEETLERMPGAEPRTIGDILAVDEESRRVARQVIEARPVNASARR